MKTNDFNQLLSPDAVHVMVDLETWGTAPGCAISTIGAVWECLRGETGYSDESGREAVVVEGPVRQVIHRGIKLESCLLAGLVVEPGTVKWWRSQSHAARHALCETKRGDLGGILREVAGWLPSGQEYFLWGNGAAADPVWLEAAYRAAGQEVPWKHWQVACFRTLKNLMKGEVPAPAFTGTAHDALDDARHQMQHLQAMLAVLRETFRPEPEPVSGETLKN